MIYDGENLLDIDVFSSGKWEGAAFTSSSGNVVFYQTVCTSTECFTQFRPAGVNPNLFIEDRHKPNLAKKWKPTFATEGLSDSDLKDVNFMRQIFYEWGLL